jgi:hypothetical protein
VTVGALRYAGTMKYPDGGGLTVVEGARPAAWTTMSAVTPDGPRILTRPSTRPLVRSALSQLCGFGQHPQPDSGAGASLGARS